MNWLAEVDFFSGAWRTSQIVPLVVAALVVMMASALVAFWNRSSSEESRLKTRELILFLVSGALLGLPMNLPPSFYQAACLATIVLLQTYYAWTLFARCQDLKGCAYGYIASLLAIVASVLLFADGISILQIVGLSFLVFLHLFRLVLELGSRTDAEPRPMELKWFVAGMGISLVLLYVAPPAAGFAIALTSIFLMASLWINILNRIQSRFPVIARWFSEKHQPLAAFGCYVLIFAACWHPVAISGEVMAVSNMCYHLGAPESYDGRRFSWCMSDQIETFVPLLHQSLNSKSRHRLALWNPHSEFGTPTLHSANLSNLHFIPHVLSLFIEDAFVLYSWMTLVICFLAGTFAFLLFSELGVKPFGAMAGALFLSCGMTPSYLTYFSAFPSTYCWTCCLLWVLVVYCRTGNLIWLLAIVVAVFSFLVTGNLAIAPPHIFMVMGVAVTSLLWFRVSWKQLLVRGTLLLLAAIVGASLCAPVVLDIAVAQKRSVRQDHEEFGSLLKKSVIRRCDSAATEAVRRFDPFIIGNPVDSMEGRLIADLPVQPWFPVFFGPVFAILLAAGVVSPATRKWWPVCLFAAAVSALSYSDITAPVVHLVLGLSLSSIPTDYVTIIPLSLIIGLGFDTIAGARRGWHRVAIVVFAILIALFISCVQDPQVVPHFAFISLYLFGLSCGAMLIKSRSLMVGAIAISVVLFSSDLLITRPTVLVRTELTDTVNAALTTEDGRFAVAREKGNELLSPQSYIFSNLRSIHTYNSFVPRIYKPFIETLGETQGDIQDRRFKFLKCDSLKYDVPLRLSCIEVIVASCELDYPWLELEKKVGRNFVYKVAGPHKHFGIVRSNFEELGPGSVQWTPESPELESLEDIVVTEKLDDFMQFDVAGVHEPSLIFMSQQFHPQWVAYSESGPLETVEINSFFQGILVPADANVVNIEFAPYSRWLWISQLVIGCLVVLLILLWLIHLRGVDLMGNRQRYKDEVSPCG
ncbi:hypothetical protein AB1K70_08040 [Bremerella sp. JC770]|uniref:hypothetical protein n=1 Tax=Bremerella sp. JC770 TaxID=3232137 RepID=UPI003459B7ED